MKTSEIYLDNAAMTPIDPRVRDAMAPYLDVKFGNPSSLYGRGRQARSTVETCRSDVAEILNCKPYEVIFTSGGSEGDNLAIRGIANSIKYQVLSIKDGENFSTSSKNNFEKGFSTSSKNKMGPGGSRIRFGMTAERDGEDSKPHMITTQIEHHAVLNVFEQLEKDGFDVTYLGVDKDGLIDLEELKKAIRPETVLVSTMYANNEIGTIQPIRLIGEILRQAQDDTGHKIYFHTDACQAAGYLDLDVEKLGVDLLSLNGSKIYGPVGMGVLYKRKGVKLEPLFYGGGQEQGLRPGTENVPGIVGLAMALKIVQMEKDQENRRLKELRDFLIDGLTSKITNIRLNGHPEKRLPGNVNVSILNVEGEAMLLMLDDAKICASTGSACTSGSLEPSHVLLALGLSPEAAHGSLRFSLGRTTDKYELVRVLEVLPAIVERLRELSPLRLGEEAFWRKDG